MYKAIVKYYNVCMYISTSMLVHTYMGKRRITLPRLKKQKGTFSYISF